MTIAQAPVPTELRLGPGAPPWSAESLFETVHIGHSSALLIGRRTRRPLPLTAADHGVVPGGVCLPRDFPRVVRAARSGGLDLGGWGRVPADAITRVDLTVRPGPIDPRAVAAFRAGLAVAPGPGVVHPEPLRSLASPLTVAALADDEAAVGRSTTRLIGAGPGSTPTGDDVVIGVLAGLDRAGRDRAARLVRAALPARWHRTTTLSRLGLEAAAAGLFAERVLHLIAASADPDAVPAALGRAAGWGATSGLDLAAGIAAVLRHAVAAAPAPHPPSLKRSA